jgi:translocation and assembly module TamA
MQKILVLAALLLALPAAAAVPQLQAPAEVRALLSEFLDLDELPDVPAQTAFERRMQVEVASLLATQGYFSPIVVLRRDAEQLLLEVDPGPRSHIGSVRLEIVGDLDPARREALNEAWKLKAGQPFRQADWDDAKQSLLADLLAVDYAGARLRDTQAEVDPEARRVDLRVVAESGPRYRFGELRITGLKRYSADLVQRLNRSVKSGDDYREDRLLALQAALQTRRTSRRSASRSSAAMTTRRPLVKGG